MNTVSAISHVNAVSAAARRGVNRDRYGGMTMHWCRSMLIRVSVHSNTKPHTNCGKTGEVVSFVVNYARTTV